MTCWLFLLIGSSESFSTHGDVLTVMWHTFHEKKKIQSKKTFSQMPAVFVSIKNIF